VRAFLAFDLDEELLDGVIALADVLRERRVGEGGVVPRWCKRETMHVTARFFGNGVELATVTGLAHQLAGERTAPRVRCAKVDAYPDARRARVLVLAIQDDGTVGEIASEAEAAARALGFAPEERAYRAHLTIARFKEPADVRKLVAETKVALEGRVTALTLYESKLGPQGPTYTALERAAFAS
jgi:RNA 2',3'-cyclic 3'-phosphodiesterase